MFKFIRSIASKISKSDPGSSRSGGMWFWKPTAAGVRIDDQVALTYSVVFRCVSIISQTMGSLPFRVLRTEGDMRKVQNTHPVDRILNRIPNLEMPAVVFKETIQAHALLRGNGYAEIERNRLGKIIGLWIITPDRVTPKRDGNGRLVYEINNDDNTVTVLPANKIFHLKGLGYDGLVGYSPVQLAQEAIALGLATQEFGASFFGNGAVLGGVIEQKDGQGLSEGGVKNLLKTFNKKHKGARQAHKTEVLDAGMTYKQIGIPPEQGQFLESRKFQVTEIARWFGVQPHKLADLERATFSNIEEQNIEFVTDTIIPWAVRWEQEAYMKLLDEDEQEDHSIKVNVKGLLRGNIKDRGEYYKTMFNMGAYSINEIRRKEDDNPIGPEGDLRMVPLNMVSVEQAYRTGSTSKKIDQAHNKIIIGALERMQKRELSAIKGAAKKSSDVQDFSNKLTEFYTGHIYELVNAVTPGIEAICANAGKVISEGTINNFAIQWCSEYITHLKSAFPDMNNLEQHWANRPTDGAEKLIAESVATKEVAACIH